ncbi:MAG TPA: hypothetical protein VGO53_00790, partial [Steroidobacteraceae bacterium]|nr:hypothetical protein [Steroidobacteraceae bacterium]
MMKIIRPMLAGLASFVLCVSSQAAEPGGDNPYPGASHVPDSQSGWDDDPTGADLHAPLDEAQGGVTARGTHITKRNADCFPAETRNLFADVDGVAKVPGEKPEPFDYTNGHGVIDDEGRAAIRGQNTWMLWGEGNEAFWGWLQEQGYGLVDFLVLLDSRKRAGRFESGGMINQPGMKEADSAGTLLGLHLDVADGENITLKQPSTDVD